MFKRTQLALFIIVILCASIFAGGQDESTTSIPAGDRPDTWIADRHIVGIAFAGDVGSALPDDQINNPVAQEIKRLTGISFEWQYLEGESDIEMMAATLASGNLPDVICFYLDHSARPEFPILLKAAREGMFTDIAPYLREGNVYSKYFEKGYLPIDTEKNVMFRDEFAGGAYLAHLYIPRTPDAEREQAGNLFIKTSIAESLGIDPREINTMAEFTDLLRKIKSGGFTDKNGRPVVPLGPSVWAGIERYHYMDSMVPGKHTNYIDLINGRVKHILQTDYPYKMLRYTQQLLEEGLMHREFYTIDSPRAYELSMSGNSAVIADVHNYHKFFKSEDYLPITLDNFYGTQDRIRRKKRGWSGWAVPASTENPEEVVQFFDFLATRQGKLLTRYGIEGEHYDMVNNTVRVKESMLELRRNDQAGLRNLGIGADWIGLWGLPSMTDNDDMADFGEFTYGELVSSSEGQRAKDIFEYGFADKTAQYFDGLFPLAYLNDFGASDNLKQLLDGRNFAKMMVEAFYQDDYAAGKAVIDNYRRNAEAAGLKDFTNYLQNVYETTPELIAFVYKD